MAALEADGKICRNGKMRNGQPVFVAKKLCDHRDEVTRF
jgi:hypothetical protein